MTKWKYNGTLDHPSPTGIDSVLVNEDSKQDKPEVLVSCVLITSLSKDFKNLIPTTFTFLYETN